MDFDVVSASESVDKLKCTLCKSYLSFLPVYISDKNENICGRCPIPQNSIKNEAYETIAQYIQFPCRYKNEGCLEKVLSQNIPQHEQVCSYRTVKCATFHLTGCDWEGPRPTLFHHCQDKHFDLILKNGEFEMDLSKCYQCANLLEYDNMFFIITRRFYSINKLLEFTVNFLQCELTAKNYSCQVSFKNNKRHVVIQCNATPFNEQTPTEIFLDSLRDRDSNTYVILGKISLEKRDDVNDVMFSTKERINEEMLSQLKCSSCSGYVMPPIYQHNNNTLTCSECRKKTSVNFSLKNNQEIRNFNLDKIANLLNYPCKYRESGCSLILKPNKMEEHQLVCPYRYQICPVSEYATCNWHGLGKDVEAHIEENHQNMIFPTSEEISESINGTFGINNGNTLIKPSKFSDAGFPKCYLFKFAKHLFQLTFTKIEQRYCWAMQIINGNSQDNYKYEIEILSKNKDKRLVVRQSCSLLYKKDYLFTNIKEYFYFDTNQIKHLLSEQNNIIFRVLIFK